MDELDEIDREAIRCGRKRYISLLEETEKEMQKLVAFWRGCGLVTGERTPPSPWWLDPKVKLRGVFMPDYLMEWLDRLPSETRNVAEYTKKRFIEITRWKEAVLNADSEPTVADTPYPQLLVDELDLIWLDYDCLDQGEKEDKMIARISRWRRSKDKQPRDEETHASPQPSAVAGEELLLRMTTPPSSGPKNLLQRSASELPFIETASQLPSGGGVRVRGEKNPRPHSAQSFAARPEGLRKASTIKKRTQSPQANTAKRAEKLARLLTPTHS